MTKKVRGILTEKAWGAKGRAGERGDFFKIRGGEEREKIVGDVGRRKEAGQ